MRDLSNIHNTAEIRGLVGLAEGYQLARDLDAEPPRISLDAPERLQVAASIALVQMLSEKNIDDLLRYFREQVQGDDEAVAVFLKWDAYLSLLTENSRWQSIDDFVYFANAG